MKNKHKLYWRARKRQAKLHSRRSRPHPFYGINFHWACNAAASEGCQTFANLMNLHDNYCKNKAKYRHVIIGGARSGKAHALGIKPYGSPPADFGIGLLNSADRNRQIAPGISRVSYSNPFALQSDYLRKQFYEEQAKRYEALAESLGKSLYEEITSNKLSSNSVPRIINPFWKFTAEPINESTPKNFDSIHIAVDPYNESTEPMMFSKERGFIKHFTPRYPLPTENPSDVDEQPDRIWHPQSDLHQAYLDSLLNAHKDEPNED